MLINVPQYIDVEDKIAGPVTAKQLVWLVVMGLILLFMWNVMPKVVFFIAAVPVVLLFLALAFYKPYGQPLGNFVVSGFMYLFKPKIYVWRRTAEKIPIVPKKTEQVDSNMNYKVNDKVKVLQNISALAQLIDSNGTRRDPELEDILNKKQQINKK